MLVSQNALIKRINRKLATVGQVLKASRGLRTTLSIGRYYLVDVNCNVIFGHDVDPEQLGREIGCLAPYEKVAPT
jgi:hypothetical protein